MSFTPLHLHTVYSYLDGYCKIPDLMKRCKELDIKVCAITDHNHLAGIPEFQTEAFKYGIKPILGMEGYFTPDTKMLSSPVAERNKAAEVYAVNNGIITQAELEAMSSTQLKDIHKKYGYKTTSYHIILLAKDQQGWNNLVKLQSEMARLCTFGGRYHCDLSLLRQYHEGIVCTTACVAGYSAVMIGARQFGPANLYLEKLQDIFGEDFYLEIQPWNNTLQHEVNQYYLQWSKQHDINTVATNDTHWVLQEQYEEHDILTRIGLKKTLGEDSMTYDPVFWLRSEEEMVTAFEEQLGDICSREPEYEKSAAEYTQYYLKALKTTQEVADKVDPDIRLGSEKHLFPVVKLPNNMTAEQVLIEKAEKGLERYLESNKFTFTERIKYRKQLKYELKIINKKGFAPYFLTVEEWVSWCRNQKIAVGPGRGSAAGSLVLFSLGITKVIDPLKFKLMFSRFMTADRTAMPDIDIDVSWLRRGEVVQHLADYYGKDCVSHIGTITKLKVKSAVKDVARVLGMSFADSIQISKVIDSLSDDPNLSFSMIDSWSEGDEQEQAKYRKFKKLEEENARIFELARKFEGIPRQAGIHASGILVTPVPVSDIFPVKYVDNTAVTLWDGVTVDEFNSVKLDILGLKTLDIITKAIQFKDPEGTIEDLYSKLDLEDPDIYKMLGAGKTEAVFQLESGLMKGVIDAIKPTGFEDIVVVNSLARPGPISCKMHEDYAKGKLAKENIHYLIRGCEDILDSTFGVLCYQEELMSISKKIAGFNDNQADSITRKVVAKKKAKLWPMLIRCHTFGKKNCEGPEGWEENDNLPWYDPKGKYGDEIPGAVAKGYSKEEVEKFFKDIEAYSSYCFNRSHAACYSLLGIMTAYLKLKTPAEFWAAVLSITDDNEKKSKYINICERDGIPVRVPDINLSGADFTPVDGKILYGLGGIHGIGAATLVALLKERDEHGPYESLENAKERHLGRIFKKNIAQALVKAGAFGFEEENRYVLLNRILEIYKDKKSGRNNINAWSKENCMKLELETLGIPITYKPWWNTVAEGETVKNVPVTVLRRKEITDKNGRLMAFVKFNKEGSEFDALLFAPIYSQLLSATDAKFENTVLISGIREKNQLIVKKVKPFVEEEPVTDLEDQSQGAEEFDYIEAGDISTE